MATYHIDCKGKCCPLPIIDVAKRFKELKVGDMLEIEADDPAFEMDIKAWVECMDYELIGIKGTKIKTATVKKTK